MRGLLPDPRSAQLTLGEFLRVWLEGPEVGSLAPTTREQYERMCRVHIVPALGRSRLSELGPERIEAAYASLTGQGKSPRTVEYVHTVLRKALSSALRYGLVEKNAAALAKRPSGPKESAGEEEIRVLSPEEIERLLGAAEGTRFRNLYAFLLYTGLRVGEALALAWQDVDLDGEPAR